MLAMLVAEHDVRGDQAGAFRAVSLRSVAEGAVLLEDRRAACRCSLVRLGTKTEKDAGRSGPLFRRAVEAGAAPATRRGVRPRRVAGRSGVLRFLANRYCRKKR